MTNPAEMEVKCEDFLKGDRGFRKQLRSLSDGGMLLNPGEQGSVFLGFRGVPKGRRQEQVSLRREGNGGKQGIRCDIPIAAST